MTYENKLLPNVDMKGNAERLDTIEKAQENIADMYKRGIRPVVTVKPKWVDTLKQGLPKHASWIPGFNEVVGTMGIKPYAMTNEKRFIVEVNVPSPQQIRPRLTGPDKSFHGVVVLAGPILPENIRILEEPKN